MNYNEHERRPKYIRDKELRDIKKSHRAHPHKGIAKPVTEDTILTFGKYKGQRIRDVPIGYLQFLTKQIRKSNNLYTDNIFDRIRQYVEENF
jgi:hypothetical protein